MIRQPCAPKKPASLSTPFSLSRRVLTLCVLSTLLCLLQFPPHAFAMNGSSGQGEGSSPPSSPNQMDQMPMKLEAGVAAPAPGISSDGFVLEFLLGADTVFNNPTYGTLEGVVNNGDGTYTEIPGGPNVPYGFGTGPTWAVRAGKMVYQDLLVYLTFQQTYFAHNTHSIFGLGANYYLPSPGKSTLRPYLNAIFGASDNTFTGTNAQTGYSWMIGAGALLPITSSWGIFVEADLAYETPPTGITTNIGAPPGTISSVSNVWDVPVMIGIRYAF